MIQIFLIIGIFSIVISGMFLGVWTSGQQQRANYHSETKKHREFRSKVGIYSGLIGLASLVVAGILFYI